MQLVRYLPPKRMFEANFPGSPDKHFASLVPNGLTRNVFGMYRMPSVQQTCHSQFTLSFSVAIQVDTKNKSAWADRLCLC